MKIQSIGGNFAFGISVLKIPQNNPQKFQNNKEFSYNPDVFRCNFLGSNLVEGQIIPLVVQNPRNYNYNIKWADTPIMHTSGAVTKQETDDYVAKVSTIALMDEEAYTNLAEKIKHLSELNYKVDSLNPDNLIIDEKNQQLDVVDYFKIPEDEDKEAYKNCYRDITSLALDFFMLPEFYENMNEAQKKEFIINTTIIDSKAYLGALYSGLSADKNDFDNYINHISQLYDSSDNDEYIKQYDKRITDFIYMLNNPDSWEEARNKDAF